MSTLHSSPYLMNSFLDEFPDLVLRHGGNLSQLCASVGLPVHAVTQKHKLIPFDKFIGLLEVAANTFDSPGIAFQLASRQNLSTLGPIAVMLENCKTFEQALDQILKYFRLLTSGFRIVPKLVGESLELNYEINMPHLFHRQQFQNYLLASCVSVFRVLTGRSYPIRACYFTSEEQQNIQQAYTDFFGCPVAFGADAIRLVFSRDILNAPIKPLPKQNTGLLTGFDTGDNIAKQLDAILPIYLASGDVRQETVAQAIGLSKPSFRRRLKEASISFSDSLNRIRLDHANQYLESSHYSLNDISALLGYNNQSAFTRSYIRWTGITPSQYRKTLKDAQISRVKQQAE